MTGTFHIVGVGPGDSELMTIKAARVIGECDVVAFPTAEGGQSMARTIAGECVRSDHILAPFQVPMSVDRAPANAAYDTAARELCAHLDTGYSVALLCEGDPFFYGSAMYLFDRIATQYPTQVVPGVSSLTACAAESQRPIAARNDVLKVLPAPLPAEDLKRELRNAEAAAIIKVGRHFAKVRSVLEELDIIQYAAIVEAATLHRQKVTPVSEFPEDGAPYFSTILIYRGEEPWR